MHVLYYVVDLDKMKILKIFRKKREAQWYMHDISLSRSILGLEPLELVIIRGIL